MGTGLGQWIQRPKDENPGAPMLGMGNNGMKAGAVRSNSQRLFGTIPGLLDYLVTTGQEMITPKNVKYWLCQAGVVSNGWPQSSH